MQETSFARLELADGKIVYLLTTCSDDADEFGLILSNGTNVWTGHVNEDDLDTQRTKLKMDFKTIKKKTEEAFTAKKARDVYFQYKLHLNKNKSAEFLWYKYVPDQDISFQLGSVNLKPAENPSEAMCKIFDHSIDRSNQLQNKVKEVETDNGRLSKERVTALTRLEKCVVAKEELEKDLYAKFVDVLNSKKEKIRQLKHQVENGHTATATVNSDDDDNSEPTASTSRNSTSQSGQGVAKRRKDDDENLSGSDTTDEERETTTQKNKRAKYTKLSPKKSLDSSLVLDDEDDDEGSKQATVARPNRRVGRNKKQTPSKPVLPKVSSKEKYSADDRPSLRKSSSNSSSNKSAENIDADDLLEGL